MRSARSAVGSGALARWCGRCPLWPSLMATVESSDMEVVAELGVPLVGVQFEEGKERGGGLTACRRG